MQSTGVCPLDTDPPTAEYRHARPFPHAIFDGIFQDERLRRVAREIKSARIDPEAPGYGWFGKRRISDLGRLPAETRKLIEEMNSEPFLAWLEKLTGIANLKPDPYLEGGGVHQIPPGGFLKIHTDFNWHRRLRLHRRVNALLYLNEGWKEEWGGHLELWHERDVERADGQPTMRIAPIFNRMVVFSTTDSSYHGHPEKLACPAGTTRNSIALYYYSEGRPSEEVRFGKSVMTNYREHRAADNLGLKHKIHQILIRYPKLRGLFRL